MPPHHPAIAHALGLVRRRLGALTRRDEPGLPRAVHVACSGGADSVALLGVLHCLARRERLRLSVGHVHHGLRAESDEEATQVEALAGRLGLPFACTRLRLGAGAGLPARARDERRHALWEQARAHGATFIALGHTATDQAETMLLHLTRGAGLDGLAAMAGLDPFPDEWGCNGGWLRPLLDLDRSTTRELAQHLALPFCDDPTNTDHRHPRVRMRHEVLAVLRELNPRVEAALARASTHARDAEAALAQWVERELAARRLAAPDSAGASEGIRSPQAHTDPPERAGLAVTLGARWSTHGLQEIPVAVRTRFVRHICRGVGAPDDALPARTLASIDDALVHPGPARSWNLHPHLRLHVAQGALWIEADQVHDQARASRGQPLTP